MDAGVASGMSTLVGSLTSMISVADIFAILGIVVGAAGVFVLAWFGIRKLTKAVMGALKGGSLKM